ncbi:hypothetical protein [Vibrio phage TCU-VP03-AIR1]|nr:hypothetical protein pp2_096 [Vibrio phage phi-pp2]QIW90936.1 hypothetical protein COHAPHLL_00073 [Vibrio phage V09]WOL25009.1 hypothetical protein [Vibrio phage PG216]
MLLADYIKHAMQEYHTIFPTRFSVLEHLFATNGNGITLKNGYIYDRETRDVKQKPLLSREDIILEVKDASEHSLGMWARFVKELGDEHPELVEKFKKKIDAQLEEDERTVERLCNIDEAYKIHPDLTNLHVYAWGGDRRYIPMYDFENSKYDDTIEQLEYFRDCIANATVREVTEDDSQTDQFYARGLVSWKENIGEIDKIIEKLRK